MLSPFTGCRLTLDPPPTVDPWGELTWDPVKYKPGIAIELHLLVDHPFVLRGAKGPTGGGTQLALTKGSYFITIRGYDPKSTQRRVQLIGPLTKSELTLQADGNSKPVKGDEFCVEPSWTAGTEMQHEPCARLTFRLGLLRDSLALLPQP